MKSEGIRLGDVRSDLLTGELTGKDGQPAQLRHKSRAVLSFLLDRPNRTVTKAEIMDSVWAGATVTDESLVQCIADIRRIIGPDARKIIETVPREGYRINVPDQTMHPSPVRIVVLGALTITACTAWLLWQDTTFKPDSLPNDAVLESSTSPPGTEITEAFLEVLQGRASANRFSLSESLVAERHFRRAIDLDPNYARAHAELGALLAVRFENNWTVLKEADKEKALHYADTAISLDPDSWLGHYALGRLHSVFSNLDLAEAHLETAMSLEPGNEDARAYLGIVRNFRGETDEAVAILQQAVSSHPEPPYWYFLGLGNALFNAGRNEASVDALESCLSVSPNSPYCLRYLMAVYGTLGRTSDAQTATAAYELMGFEASVDAIMDVMTFHHPEAQNRLAEGLKSAGLEQ